MQRGYVAGKFGLELDAMAAGWLVSFEGGMPTTEVVLEKIGPDHLQHKHISGLQYEDITLTFGTAMSENFWKWIQASFDRNYARKNGAVVAANFDLKETSRINFFNALISELTFPGCDATSRDAARVTAKLTPEYTRPSFTPDGGAAVQYQGNRRKQHFWSPSNFRLTIDGTPVPRVYKIEPLTLRQKTTLYQVGEFRDYEVEPVQVEYPNLTVTMPESHAKPLIDWYNSFVVDGQCTQDNEKTGSLEYLSPNLSTWLFRLDFNGLGIFKLAPDKAEAGSEDIRRIKFDMYCESIKFNYNPDAVFA